MQNINMKLFTDGGARGNPGPAASAYVLFSGDQVVDQNFKFLGSTTNNIAEYNGLLMGLEAVLAKGIDSVDCFADSELMVKQINGQYKVKDTNIKIVFDKVKALISGLVSFSITHVPREKNSLADKLVNQCLDKNNG